MSKVGFFQNLLGLLLKVTKVTTGHQKCPKIGQNSIISSFFPEGQKKPSAEGRSPAQKLKVDPRSGPYLLVFLISSQKLRNFNFQEIPDSVNTLFLQIF